ncbi:MAG: DUF2892 domain-containing protein [Phycisphaerae bacterium]|jgi:hypothetical protein
MQQNIDRRGRIARAGSGVLCIALGVAVWLFHWPEPVTYRVMVSLAAVLAGAFQLFEAKRGWCALRACGLRTPM